MDRRRFLLTSLAGVVAAPLVSQSQPAWGLMKRLGILSIGLPSTPEEMAKSPFGTRLQELGWTEGNNLSVERRYGKGAPDELEAMAHDLVGLKVDVILAGSAHAAAAAKRATTTVPIVFHTLGDPVEQGLVQGFPRPGGNITGVAGAQTAGKRIEILAELVPKISRVAALVNGANPATAGTVRDMDKAVRARGLQLMTFAVNAPADLDKAWAAMGASRPNGAVVSDDALLFRIRADIRDRAARMRLPVVYGHRDDALEGGLAALGIHLGDQFSRAAGYIDRILRGANPGELPIQRAERFELLINLKTAKALGLTIPRLLLARADQVIE
jgi:putative tryptophan/tyrosine transport system substrate-binding protein